MTCVLEWEIDRLHEMQVSRWRHAIGRIFHPYCLALIGAADTGTIHMR